MEASAALRAHGVAWAIGVVRVLLDRREAPVRSLAEVPAKAEQLVEMQRAGLWAALAWTGGEGRGDLKNFGKTP
jgi:hypothetical protein